MIARPARIAATVVFATVAAWLPSGPAAAAAAPVCRLTVGPAVHQPYSSIGIVSKPGQVSGSAIAECFTFEEGGYPINLWLWVERSDGGPYEQVPGTTRPCSSTGGAGYTVRSCTSDFVYESATWAAQAWRVCAAMSAPRDLGPECRDAPTTPIAPAGTTTVDVEESKQAAASRVL